MNDATAWIDPELVAVGKLLQSRGLVAPDRTQVPLNETRAAADWIGASLGEGSAPRLLSRRVLARLSSIEDVDFPLNRIGAMHIIAFRTNSTGSPGEGYGPGKQPSGQGG